MVSALVLPPPDSSSLEVDRSHVLDLLNERPEQHQLIVVSVYLFISAGGLGYLFSSVGCFSGFILFLHVQNHAAHGICAQRRNWYNSGGFVLVARGAAEHSIGRVSTILSRPHHRSKITIENLTIKSTLKITLIQVCSHILILPDSGIRALTVSSFLFSLLLYFIRSQTSINGIHTGFNHLQI